MKKILLSGSMVLASLISSNVMAADAAAGKAKSAVCAACHGADGQKEAYLAKQIKAFRDGIRKDPTMSPMAAGLTDADVDNLAAYFSSLK